MAAAPIPRAASFFSPRRFLLRILALLLLLYLADFAWYGLRLRLSRFGPVTGSVHRIRLLAVPGKNNKVEYQIDPLQPEENVPCSHSLFSQGGNRPCWYVSRHANDPIPM